jgi:hypothetical protein
MNGQNELAARWKRLEADLLNRESREGLLFAYPGFFFLSFLFFSQVSWAVFSCWNLYEKKKTGADLAV